jgi:hypothetical protein
MHLPFGLSSKAGPASINVTAGIALREYFQEALRKPVRDFILDNWYPARDTSGRDLKLQSRSLLLQPVNSLFCYMCAPQCDCDK